MSDRETLIRDGVVTLFIHELRYFLEAPSNE